MAKTFMASTTAVSHATSQGAKRRRESSDEFGTGSLGSIGGSAFEGGGGEIPLPPTANSGPLSTSNKTDTVIHIRRRREPNEKQTHANDQAENRAEAQTQVRPDIAVSSSLSSPTAMSNIDMPRIRAPSPKPTTDSTATAATTTPTATAAAARDPVKAPAPAIAASTTAVAAPASGAPLAPSPPTKGQSPAPTISTAKTKAPAQPPTTTNAASAPATLPPTSTAKIRTPPSEDSTTVKVQVKVETEGATDSANEKASASIVAATATATNHVAATKTKTSIPAHRASTESIERAAPLKDEGNATSAATPAAPPAAAAAALPALKSEPVETTSVRLKPAIKATATKKLARSHATSHGSEGSFTTSGPPKKRRRASSVDFSLTIGDDEVFRMLTRKLPSNLEAQPTSDGDTTSGGPIRVGSGASVSSIHTHGMALDHLDELGAEAGAAAEALVELEERSHEEMRSRKSSMDSQSSNGSGMPYDQRELLEAFLSQTEEKQMKRRDRFESWGGMSDLSGGGLDTDANSSLTGNTAAAAAFAASALSLDSDTLDIDVSAHDSVSAFLNDEAKTGEIPDRVGSARTRFMSVTSTGTEPSTSLMDFTDAEFTPQLQAMLKGTMELYKDEIAGIAAAMESGSVVDIANLKDASGESDHDSATSLLLNISDNNSKCDSVEGRWRSSSISSALNFSFDLDALEHAMKDTDESGKRSDFTDALLSSSVAHSPVGSGCSVGTKTKRRRPLPMHRKKSADSSSLDKKPAARPSTSRANTNAMKAVSGRNMELIRERARAAAGYVPPSFGSSLQQRLPARKRIKKETIEPQTPKQGPSQAFTTPKTSNVAARPPLPASQASTAGETPASAKSTPSKVHSSQKWDNTLECLRAFVRQRRDEETKGLPEDKKAEWVWDGNVPTTYKTKKGQALGRWVNNQRSAKSKGTLKPEREKKLTEAGLKWSVLASNSWNEMLAELRIYIDEQIKAGRQWDGNVPTNYRIKTKAGGKNVDENKNLGRWVNRQRSLYQANRLRADRQAALEEVGLKWSMLTTTPWDCMFETLQKYIADRMQESGEWDGNVPANYKTPDKQWALGRWVNRQRTARVKNSLKQVYADKLDKVGLKWSVHERRPITCKTTSPAPSAAQWQATAANSPTPPTPMPEMVVSGTVPKPAASPVLALASKGTKTNTALRPMLVTSTLMPPPGGTAIAPTSTRLVPPSVLKAPLTAQPKQSLAAAAAAAKLMTAGKPTTTAATVSRIVAAGKPPSASQSLTQAKHTTRPPVASIAARHGVRTQAVETAFRKQPPPPSAISKRPISSSNAVAVARRPVPATSMTTTTRTRTPATKLASTTSSTAAAPSNRTQPSIPVVQAKRPLPMTARAIGKASPQVRLTARAPIPRASMKSVAGLRMTSAIKTAPANAKPTTWSAPASAARSTHKTVATMPAKMLAASIPIAIAQVAPPGVGVPVDAPVAIAVAVVHRTPGTAVQGTPSTTGRVSACAMRPKPTVNGVRSIAVPSKAAAAKTAVPPPNVLTTTTTATPTKAVAPMIPTSSATRTIGQPQQTVQTTTSAAVAAAPTRPVTVSTMTVTTTVATSAVRLKSTEATATTVPAHVAPRPQLSTSTPATVLAPVPSLALAPASAQKATLPAVTLATAPMITTKVPMATATSLPPSTMPARTATVPPKLTPEAAPAPATTVKVVVKETTAAPTTVPAAPGATQVAPVIATTTQAKQRVAAPEAPIPASVKPTPRVATAAQAKQKVVAPVAALAAATTLVATKTTAAPLMPATAIATMAPTTAQAKQTALSPVAATAAPVVKTAPPAKPTPVVIASTQPKTASTMALLPQRSVASAVQHLPTASPTTLPPRVSPEASKMKTLVPSKAIVTTTMTTTKTMTTATSKALPADVRPNAPSALPSRKQASKPAVAPLPTTTAPLLSVDKATITATTKSPIATAGAISRGASKPDPAKPTQGVMQKSQVPSSQSIHSAATVGTTNANTGLGAQDGERAASAAPSSPKGSGLVQTTSNASSVACSLALTSANHGQPTNAAVLKAIEPPHAAKVVTVSEPLNSSK